ncbi:MAG: signal peptidase II [Acidimicrobiaceae bacterium]|nr:signal peptidase II [Acidimicrobiaceae bacterium]
MDKRGETRRFELRRSVVLLILGVVLVDQASKFWALDHFNPASRQSLFGLVDLTIYRNSGASHGLLAGYPYLLLPLEIIGVVVVFYLANRSESRFLALALALIAGGGLGNLTDRILHSHGFGSSGRVVDWISLPGSRTVFNLADVAIQIGVVAVAVGMVISFFKADRQPSSNVHGSSTIGNIFRWMRPTKVEESA